MLFVFVFWRKTLKMELPKYLLMFICASSLEALACLASEFYLEDYFYHLQSFEDTIGAGNYTNFKLTKNGNIRIYLQSLSGDADIYVSETNSKPTFEDYDLKSVTCGDDYVDIPDSFQRPTAIAIYGHPRQDESVFRCSVFLDRRDPSQSDIDIPQQGAGFDLEEDHPGWAFLFKVLEFILEVAL